MYIEPNSIVKLCANVPLDDSYDHAVNWSSKEQQQQYFESKVIKVFPKVYYQRPYLGQIKVEASADEIFNCNYLMFQNTSYGNKWFYAFVNKVEYSNNNTAVLLYNIDLLTTWHFDYQLLESLVVREHVKNDAKYENLVNENLDLGRGYKNTIKARQDLSEMYATIVSSKEVYNDEGVIKFRYADGEVINGMYTPLKYYPFDLTNKATVASLNSAIRDYVESGQENLIVNIYQYPKKFGKDGKVTLENFVEEESLDGYIPRNYKLYNYPYNFVTVSNNAGQTAEFKYELSEDTDHDLFFNTKACTTPIPACICYPINYRGIRNDFDSGIVINNFPQCAWIGDTYKAWWAQNKASVAFQGSQIGSRYLKSFLNNAIGFQADVSGQFMSGLGNSVYRASLGQFQTADSMMINTGTGILRSGINQMGRNVTTGVDYLIDKHQHAKGVMAKKEDLENTPPQVHGQTQTEGLNVATHKLGYSFFQTTIYADAAKRLDAYFDRYGYEVDMFKTPSRQNRKHFTYLKTNGCEVIGDMPAEDFKSICSIYDHGVTWWVNPNEVGHYELASDNLGGR